jgi:hypothetical protein
MRLNAVYRVACLERNSADSGSRRTAAGRQLAVIADETSFAKEAKISGCRQRKASRLSDITGIIVCTN